MGHAVKGYKSTGMTRAMYADCKEEMNGGAGTYNSRQILNTILDDSDDGDLRDEGLNNISKDYTGERRK